MGLKKNGTLPIDRFLDPELAVQAIRWPMVAALCSPHAGHAPTRIYIQVLALIASDASPVGIAAKKTHIIIISKLLQIEQRLERLQRKVADKDK